MKKIYTRKENIIEEINGIKVSDPFRWLERSDDPEVIDWINAQNELTDSALKDECFDIFYKDLAKNFKVNNFSNPVPVRGRYFYTERKPDEDQAVLYMKNGLYGTPTKLFDPNGKRNGNTMSIDYWVESMTGKYIAYGVSEGGDEMATLYIKDVDSGKELPENIVRCRHSTIRWFRDDSAFFYTRNPRPGTVPKNEEHLHKKVYFHKIGDDPNNDILIFGEGRPKDDMIGMGLSLDGRYLSIQVSKTWTEHDIYIYDTKTKELLPLIVGISSKFSVTFLRDKVLLATNHKANNYRVLWSTYDDLYKPLDQWKEFIPEKRSLLRSMRVTKDKILVEYLVNACSEVFIFDYEGREVDKIPLPKYSSLAGISSRREEDEFFYGVESYIFPKIIYRYDPVTLKYSEYKRIYNPIDPKDYEIRQEWCLSKDGTNVPMFIFCKKGLIADGSNPTILYGYGGFGNSEYPAFMRNFIPWIERGGIFVVANIRGGGEFGEKWHKGGIKENKQNSFDDFIAVGQYLVAKNYTSTGHLGILGGSNGGLLVSAVGIQRPDLFKAVCSRVPLTDMVRFPKFGIAMRWIHEYGDPKVKDDLKRILTWSPYHNIQENTKYPDFLFITANKDTRVDALHSRKMAAMLQGVNPENRALVYTEMDAGHGSGKPIAKVIENQALVLSFFTQELGLTM